MAELAVVTGQPLDGLLRCPPRMLAALRMAWNQHARDEKARAQFQQMTRRHGR